MTKLEIAKQQSNPLQLLRNVRDIMRSSEDAQDRLNRLVEVVANGFSSDVCSIYFAQSGTDLELYATHGLKQGAVHQTRMAFGEGLVGDIATLATPLNLPDALSHPKFVFRPETGEDKYHAFVGVPIVYNHIVIGVLVVQSVDTRIYSDDQVEVLQTVAMVLAELAVACQVVDLNEVTGLQDNAKSSAYYHSGLTLSPGLVKAPAMLHRPEIEITRFVSDDPDYEEKRLHKAVIELQESIDELIRNSGLIQDDAKREIMETYRMFTRDKGWLERISETIQSGLTAEASVRKVQEHMHMRLTQTGSAYMRERMEDLEDLSTRLLYHLSGISPMAAHNELPDAFILVARSIGPAELLEYSNTGIKGVVLEVGSATSHVSIIARMMDIPMISRIEEVATIVHSGDLAIVDGDNGEVYIRPPHDVVEAMDAHIARKQVQTAEYEAQANLPAISLDDESVHLSLNIGLYLDADQLKRPDVDGVGLYRTELSYLTSPDIPKVDEQKKIYTEVLRQSEGKPVIFRSFDIGGDKQVPYVHAGSEENPAMGWRATRIGLDRPVILRRQFRALIRAAGGHVLYVMFPFISDLYEYEETKAIFDRELDRAKVEGIELPTDIKVGSMIEIPSILYQLPNLLKHVDFVSIGSNDLLQFLYACDRGSERLSGRYDPLSPTFMNIIRMIVRECDAAGVELGFCGDMASRPLEAMALLGCGVRHLSIPPASIGPVKAMIRSVKMEQLRELLHYVVELPDHSIRSHLESFAAEHKVAFK